MVYINICETRYTQPNSKIHFEQIVNDLRTAQTFFVPKGISIITPLKQFFTEFRTHFKLHIQILFNTFEIIYMIILIGCLSFINTFLWFLK